MSFLYGRSMSYIGVLLVFFFFFQAEDGIRDAQESRGLGDVYKRQAQCLATGSCYPSPGWSCRDLSNVAPPSRAPTMDWSRRRTPSPTSARRRTPSPTLAKGKTGAPTTSPTDRRRSPSGKKSDRRRRRTPTSPTPCLLYTSDAADEEDSVDLGGCRSIKKKKKDKKE
eukprot:TRINITY_DN36683_c0_g1_i1.p1 TRINITY_DN36683_c0_g1~~TRINITY_DN36683_c0_g1_i1.p1  ORF type:complete len:168 (-),score=30.12 TRINITY_DN36683_c0_g1_i1:71-574(-)